MQIYLIQDGEKTGPFTIYDVTEEVRSGRADKDTLGWHRGSDGWERLEDMSALSSIFAPPPPRTAETEVEEMQERRAQLAPERLRSSLRLWARLLDLFLVYLVILAVIFGTGLLDLAQARAESQVLIQQVLPAAVLMVLETFLISAFGTTPGKWLLRVRVLREGGGRIPLKISLYRALTVLWRGVGFGIVPINIVMMAFSQATLLNTGKTAWDRECGLRLEYGKVDGNRVFLIIGVVLGAVVLMQLTFGAQWSELWAAAKEG